MLFQIFDTYTRTVALTSVFGEVIAAVGVENAWRTQCIVERVPGEPMNHVADGTISAFEQENITAGEPFIFLAGAYLYTEMSQKESIKTLRAVLRDMKISCRGKDFCCFFFGCCPKGV